MSIDFYIWAATCTASLPSQLPDLDHWRQHASPWNESDPQKPWWQYQTPDWLVSVDTVPIKEAPWSVKLRLGKEGQGYSVILEGGSRSEAAQKFVDGIVDTIVSSCEKAAVEGPAGISWHKKQDKS